jgi:hypothetical protein
MRVPPRVPRRYFAAAVRGDALSEVLVEHMRTMRGLSGSAIGTEREEAMMREIAETGTCMAYEDLLAQYSVT